MADRFCAVVRKTTNSYRIWNRGCVGAMRTIVDHNPHASLFLFHEGKIFCSELASISGDILVAKFVTTSLRNTAAAWKTIRRSARSWQPCAMLSPK